MEGTRHEKIILIITAYVIGFTTAFIAFGLSKMQTQTQVLFLDAKSTLQQKTGDVHDFLTSVGFGDDGLYSITKEKERILAADRNALSATVSLGAAESGYYYNIVDAEASRDGRFIYYCEQLTEDAVNCDPYVYVLAEDTLYHVKRDGLAFYPIIEEHESMWLDNNLLTVNGALSSNPERPWELMSVDSLSVQ